MYYPSIPERDPDPPYPKPSWLRRREELERGDWEYDQRNEDDEMEVRRTERYWLGRWS